MVHRDTVIGNQVGLVGIAAVAGVAISAVENFTFGGEISPIAVVALLLLAAGSLGIGWGLRAWPSLIAVWAWLPAVHVFKHVRGFPDTLHPNTYRPSRPWRCSRWPSAAPVFSPAPPSATPSVTRPSMTPHEDPRRHE